MSTPVSALAIAPTDPSMLFVTTDVGVFRSVERPVYDDLMSEQLERARAEQGEGDLTALLRSGDTWTIDSD